VTHGVDRGESLTTEFWCALLQNERCKTLANSSIPKRPKSIGCSKKVGRTPTYEKFSVILPLIRAFIQPYSQMADNRRRKTTVELDASKGCGFSLPELLTHLYTKVKGLYEYGFDVRTLHHLFAPPTASVRASQNYSGQIDARRGSRKNNFRAMTDGVHFARAV
jgi:hypothetical protein